MATATKNVSKSDFVKEFLGKHPEGNVQAVNEAWSAAGMTGSIGATLIYQTRADMGLSGQLRAKAKSKTTAHAKSPAKTTKAANSPGKSMFTKEFLNDHPQGNFSAVNKAWQAAGFKGTISKAVVDKARASLGFTGNTRGITKKSKPSANGKKLGRSRREITAAAIGKAAERPTGSNGERTDALLWVETEIDKLIFQVMFIGDLPEVETSLREARRKVYGALIS